MANLLANPWSFTTADQAATAAITSITRNGLASATVQLTAPLTGLAKNLYISIQGVTGAGLTPWNGGYRVEDLGTAANSFLIAIPLWKSTLGNVGAVGNVFTMAYPQDIEVTQMLWDNPTAATSLLVTDQAGNLVWNPLSVTGGTLTYMKAFPIFGLVLNTIGSGTLQISV